MKILFLGQKLLGSLISSTEVCNDIKTLVYTGSQLPSYGKYVAGGPHGHFKLDIFSGQFGDETQQSLITFDINGFNSDSSKSGFNYKLSDDGLVVTLGICNVETVAVESGNATWFKYYNARDPSMFVLGSIGRIGSDADLILSNTQIVQSDKYKCFGFKLLLNSKLYVLAT